MGHVVIIEYVHLWLFSEKFHRHDKLYNCVHKPLTNFTYSCFWATRFFLLNSIYITFYSFNGRDSKDGIIVHYNGVISSRSVFCLGQCFNLCLLFGTTAEVRSNNVATPPPHPTIILHSDINHWECYNYIGSLMWCKSILMHCLLFLKILYPWDEGIFVLIFRYLM